MANHGQVSVAIGVIRHGSSILLTKRMPNVDCPNLWEFPGGKVRECETLCAGLSRELLEEINIKVARCRPFIQFRHMYLHGLVLGYVYLIEDYVGEPRPLEGQKMKWVSLSELAKIEMLDANQSIISQLAII